MDERTPIVERTLEGQALVCVCNEREPCWYHCTREGEWQKVMILKGSYNYKYNYGYSRKIQ